MALADHPRAQLLFGPSPVHPLERLTAHLGGARLWAKREDCNSGLAYGGNKIRKLEYLAADALAKGCDTLVTIGGVQSNHTRQVAAVAARARPEGRAGAGVLGGLARRRLRQGRQHPAQPHHGRRRPARPGRVRHRVKESWEQPSTTSGARRHAVPDPGRRLRPPAGRARLRPLGLRGRAAGAELGVFFDTDRGLLGHRLAPRPAWSPASPAQDAAAPRHRHRRLRQARRDPRADRAHRPQHRRADRARTRAARRRDRVLDERYHAGTYGIPDERDARRDAARRQTRRHDHRSGLRGEVDGRR